MNANSSNITKLDEIWFYYFSFILSRESEVSHFYECLWLSTGKLLSYNKGLKVEKKGENHGLIGWCRFRTFKNLQRTPWLRFTWFRLKSIKLWQLNCKTYRFIPPIVTSSEPEWDLNSPISDQEVITLPLHIHTVTCLCFDLKSYKILKNIWMKSEVKLLNV